MSSGKFVNIARLMTTYNFEFEQVPDNLKCAQCKLVLKNACQVPCGCSFCNVCINDMRASGTILSDKLEREIDERCENDELDSARVLDYVDSEIAAVMGEIGVNMNEWDTQIKSVKDDIGSLNKVSQSISDNICSMKLLLESIQEIVVQGYAKCQLVINSDVGKDRWSISDDRWNGNFTGKVLPYKYRYATNSHKYIADTLSLWLHIFNGPNDEQLAWPFDGRVTITIADKDKPEAIKSISKQCRIERPLSNSCQYCDPFVFHHSELREAGLDLSRGVRVSCVIVPGAG